jgi:hypothetical protein
MERITIWRGIDPGDCTRAEVLGRPILELPEEPEERSRQMIRRICFNSQGITSFSLNRNVAEYYAGPHGWLIKISVIIDHVIVASETLKTLSSGDQAHLLDEFDSQNLTDALEWCSRDEEAFLIQGANYQIEEVIMIGSIRYNP